MTEPTITSRPSAALSPAIRADGLTKRFPAPDGRDVTAVDAIAFTVPRGSVTGLLGGNGAGKTTTISMLLGLLLPTAGTVEILGVDMARHRHAVLPRMNFSSPYVELPHRLTVRENLTVYAHLYGLTCVKKRVRELAEHLDLSRFLDRPSGGLSAGQKTRVALAKAMLNDPEVLLLDEPTASLDPDTADWIRTYLERYRLRTGATILLASHNMLEVERLCDSVLMMRQGRIVDRGAPSALVARYGRQTLEEVFLDIARASGGAASDGGILAGEAADAAE
ncbi:ABC transporter ATP-binding protein (plasmid) [Azospirillum oryzae]|uniref:ABC transporter ATP-binding protein n=1 Tax=Azospirillum oryzae TaxID=286727 RepID=A0A6N1ANQ1_9PROT|nr:ABC transporter ATP-binding protein [Azospirillum oryzae]KAA0585642.1 ABC transporter ATP-binding protein [Azospirillum oryzae]QKS49762.1 ABC transporter ATP-binding protein [Azospirillum oryzae]GLR79016.1 ABC transporter [Azospirillum oryzae]